MGARRKSVGPSSYLDSSGGAEQLASLREKKKKISQRYESEGGRLPFYEAYVLMLWRGREDSFKTTLEPADIEKPLPFADSFDQPAFSVAPPQTE